MGYAGGEKANPTYRSLGDQTECFQVDFDPTVISYEELLSLVWQSHDPTRPAYKVQYASLVLTHDDEQLAAARSSAERIAAALGRPLTTRIEPLKRFWNAEDYHQKYYLRQDRNAMKIFIDAGYDDTALMNSTYAARVNGALATGQACPVIG